MKKEILQFKVEKSRRRADFLFNDGEFRPKTVKPAKVYRRKEKHRGSNTNEEY